MKAKITIINAPNTRKIAMRRTGLVRDIVVLRMTCQEGRERERVTKIESALRLAA